MGGNSHTVMVNTVSVKAINATESLSTLQWAKRAQANRHRGNAPCNALCSIALCNARWHAPWYALCNAPRNAQAIINVSVQGVDSADVQAAIVSIFIVNITIVDSADVQAATPHE